MRALRRRLLTIPALALAWALLLALAPLTLPLALLVGALRRRRFIAARMLLFVHVYTTLELVGLLLAFGIGLGARRGSPAWLRRHVALQTGWACALFAVARRLLRLELRVEGDDAIAPGPIVLALRHASLADSLLPAALVTGPHGIRLAYVLKKELLVDPCLDVVGHRIPNHFVDRAQPTDADLEAIGALLRDADTESGAILFPEGTRFSSKKRVRVLRRLEEKGSPHLAAARALRHTLPPRLGGLAALLDANPRADVVFCAHVGLEGFATFADLLSGEVVGRTLAVRFWRVPASAIPVEREARLRWLYDQWAEVDRFVGARGDISRASAGAPPSPSRRGAERAAS